MMLRWSAYRAARPKVFFSPAAAQHDRQVVAHPRLVERVPRLVPRALVRGVLAAQHRRDDVQRLGEPVEAIGERAELQTEGVVLELVPARADAENRAPAD